MGAGRARVRKEAGASFLKKPELLPWFQEASLTPNKVIYSGMTSPSPDRRGQGEGFGGEPGKSIGRWQLELKSCKFITIEIE
ncbi:MAG: hypothetical protein DPW18_06150 [Chloroflexi bacterium]|nr:hypothetical protein [Chloroflexota bacterium]